MATKIDVLNRELRNRIKAGKPNLWSHGNGLCFALAKNGNASWTYRYSINGKRRVMTLEPFREPISEKRLKELEMAAIEYRDQIKAGIDPLDRRKRNGIASASSGQTFRETAEAYISTQRVGWRNEKHADQWKSTLETFVYTHIGALRPHEISIEDVLRVLQQPHRRRNGVKARPLWEAVPETASRVRMRIEKIISAAKSKGLGSGNPETKSLWLHHVNPARWEDGLEHWLARNSKANSHFKAMHYGDVPELFAQLRPKTDFSSRALQLTILTAVRTSEALNAVWSEFDLDAAIWTIPGERMKANREHRVPLSSAAIDLLRKQPRFQGNPYVFPGAKRMRPLSNMAMIQVLRGMKGHGWTVHGFRSSFRDWITDTTIHPNEIAESALAHAIKNKTEAAYRRGEAFERRAILMQQWSDFLTENSVEYRKKWGKYIAIHIKDHEE